jgi:hypothetical protein
MTAIGEYAALVRRGVPDFVEIKGVTFCGNGNKNPLTMKNVPWHSEVVAFASALCDAVGVTRDGVSYALASEHEHSNCVLLARKDRFLRDGVWHTWCDARVCSAIASVTRCVCVCVAHAGSTSTSFSCWRRRAARSRQSTTCCPRRTGPCLGAPSAASIRSKCACGRRATIRATHQHHTMSERAQMCASLRAHHSKCNKTAKVRLSQRHRFNARVSVSQQTLFLLLL